MKQLLLKLEDFDKIGYYNQPDNFINKATLLSRFNSFKAEYGLIQENKYNFYTGGLNLVGDIEGHCIRVQRRYNKRRYGRARPVSRPSFWAGATFCSLSLGMFWGATMENLD
jgi:hypothetical protein